MTPTQNGVAVPARAATASQPSQQVVSGIAGIANAETLADSLSRLIALHGLGTVSGSDRQAPPTAEWNDSEYRARILEIIPAAAEGKCRALAADILAAIYSFSNDREIDDGIRTVPRYAAEIIRKRDPGMVGLILNLDRLQGVLDARAAREVVAQGIEAGTVETERLDAKHESPVVEDHAPKGSTP